MPSLDVSLAFFAAALVLGIAPGPDNIFVLTQSALFGVRAGFATTLGLLSGICAHTIAVAAGVAALIKASVIAFSILKFMGALYLAYLAWLSFRAGAMKTRDEKKHFPGYFTLYKRGILMNVSNPKVLLFFLAFLPQFCRPNAWPYALQIVYFGVIFMAATLLVFGACSILGGQLARWINTSPAKQVIMNRIAAVIFLGLAIALLATDLDA